MSADALTQNEMSQFMDHRVGPGIVQNGNLDIATIIQPGGWIQDEAGGRRWQCDGDDGRVGSLALSTAGRESRPEKRPQVLPRFASPELPPEPYRYDANRTH